MTSWSEYQMDVGFFYSVALKGIVQRNIVFNTMKMNDCIVIVGSFDGKHVTKLIGKEIAKEYNKECLTIAKSSIIDEMVYSYVGEQEQESRKQWLESIPKIEYVEAK